MGKLIRLCDIQRAHKVGESDKAHAGGGRDAEKEETKERTESVETEDEYTEQAIGLCPSSADTP